MARPLSSVASQASVDCSEGLLDLWAVPWRHGCPLQGQMATACGP